MPFSVKKCHIKGAMISAPLYRLGVARRLSVAGRPAVGDAQLYYIIPPFEGMPATLAPGLRTASGAKLFPRHGRLWERGS